MTLDLGERLAMLHFREKVALSEFDDLAGGLRIVLRSRGDSSSRKGELKYAHEIMELLDQKHNGQLKSLAIVGDGAGDARFTLNLRGIAAACGRDINIVGHFFFHPELDEYYGEDGLKFYPEWRALSADLITTHRQQEFTAILVDIDRTAFLPRGLLDEVFQEIKEQAILNYVFSFRRTAASHIDKMRVVRKIVTMSNHLREYVRMGENRLHNNEEVVAFSTLLSAIGCLSERWLEKKFPRFRLLSLVDWVKKNITERSWICGLSDQVSNGAQNWYADLLLDHITEVKNSYYSGEPVICALYRKFECVALSHACRSSDDFFNSTLLDALEKCEPASLIYLSDRPRISLGIGAAVKRIESSNLFDYPLIQGLIRKPAT